jgi:hypothetical protein
MKWEQRMYRNNRIIMFEAHSEVTLRSCVHRVLEREREKKEEEEERSITLLGKREREKERTEEDQGPESGN